MKFLYIFSLCILGSLNNVKASREILTQSNEKKMTYLNYLDTSISMLIQDKKNLDERDQFSIAKKSQLCTLLDEFIHEVKTFRNAIEKDQKEDAAIARKNITKIKAMFQEF